MAQIPSGYPFYGQDIAVLVFSTTTPRIAGDAGNNASFDFPVRYEIVEGGFADLIEGSPQILNKLQTALHRLKGYGIKGVVGDCGLMSLYQREIAREGIPFVGSALCLMPALWEMVGRQGTLGVLTGHSQLLSEQHLRASGWHEGIPLCIQGMEEEKHFSEIVIQGGHHLNPDLMRQDVLSATEKLKARAKDLSALIVECTNLGTYSRDMYQSLHVPVLDVLSCAVLLQRMVHPPVFPERQ